MQKIAHNDRYAVIGHPIAHSLSPTIYQLFAKQTQQLIEYEKIEAPVDDFEKTLQHFQNEGAKGCNITLPFKAQAFSLADEFSHNAETAQAANVLVFREDGTLYADNTDGIGLIQDLTHHYHLDIRQKRILVLGAGGAVNGILGSLLEMAPSELIIANRHKEKALQLAERFHFYGLVVGVSIDEIPQGPYDLVIHGTSLGHEQKVLTLPSHLINSSTWCYDLSYGKAAQPFLQWAQLQTAQSDHCIDGIGMLIEQAAACFYLWRGVYPETGMIREQLSYDKD